MNNTPALPFPRTWWIHPGAILGGCYPGDLDPAEADRKLIALLAAGVRRVICLQEADERGRGGTRFAPYNDRLLALAHERNLVVTWSRHPIRDMGTTTPAAMREILDAITAADGVVYVHCWGGHGRTGTVAGCWMREQGMPIKAALAQITFARNHDALLRKQESPQTAAQIRMVTEWPARSVKLEPVKQPVVSAPTREPKTAPENELGNRMRGALLGMAVGDALGTTLEFSRPPNQPWRPMIRGPHIDIIGGGPFRLKPGQITDDTQMATCLASTVKQHGHAAPTREALTALADAYVAWRGHAFDIGNQTSSSLRTYAQHGDPQTSGVSAWRAGGRNAAGNGALMRAAPIGALIWDQAPRTAWAIADAAITHADPRCILANVAFTQAIAACVNGRGGGGVMFEARIAVSSAAHQTQTIVDLGADAAARWEAAEADLLADLDAAACSDPWLNDEDSLPDAWPRPLRDLTHNDQARYRLGITSSMSGFVRVAFRLAFWQMLHAQDLRSGLIDTVNRGGDADTNGAIVGALLGARDGASAIPEAWLNTVMTCNPAMQVWYKRTC